MRALNALQRAGSRCVVVDATQGFQRQEARIASQALDSGTTVQLLYNKWDLIDEREANWKRLAADRERRFPTLGDLPAIPVSALERTHLGRLPGDAAPARRRASPQAGDVGHQPLARGGAAPPRGAEHAARQDGRIYYATQTSTGPPELTLFCNAPSRLSDSYRRYLLLDLCDTFGFHGTPVRFKFRKSE
jgi:GTP-binding protein